MLLDDLKQGVRAMRAQPGFFLVAVLTLSLGIGAVTAIFTVIVLDAFFAIFFTEVGWG